MCKQEDYFQKVDLHAQQKNIDIFQCHASTGRPKPCKSFGIRDNRVLQIHISDRKPPDEPAVCLHAENNNKSFPDEDRKRFFPP